MRQAASWCLFSVLSTSSTFDGHWKLMFMPGLCMHVHSRWLVEASSEQRIHPATDGATLSHSPLTKKKRVGKAAIQPYLFTPLLIITPTHQHSERSHSHFSFWLHKDSHIPCSFIGRGACGSRFCTLVLPTSLMYAEHVLGSQCAWGVCVWHHCTPCVARPHLSHLELFHLGVLRAQGRVGAKSARDFPHHCIHPQPTPATLASPCGTLLTLLHVWTSPVFPSVSSHVYVTAVVLYVFEKHINWVCLTGSPL